MLTSSSLAAAAAAAAARKICLSPFSRSDFSCLQQQLWKLGVGSSSLLKRVRVGGSSLGEAGVGLERIDEGGRFASKGGLNLEGKRAVMSRGEAPDFTKPRVVVKKVLSKEQPEGDGALVRRSIGRPELKQLDPFLLLDYFSVSPPAGFPDHPHRGFETVTYMLEGAFTHQDFAGHKGTIKPGDLQWMTAGRGIVHCEMPAMRGVQRGLQLWVNLSSKDKLIEPNYQELEDKDIPKVESNGVKVSVIAGESLGIKSPIYTRTPTMYLDIIFQPGAFLHQPIPEGWNAFAYILEGEATFETMDSPPISAHHTVQLGPGNGVTIWNKSDLVSRVVLIGGQPLNEPVVQYGPFVMNTWDEIKQAVHDFQHTQNGFEKAGSWQSDPVILE